MSQEGTERKETNMKYNTYISISMTNYKGYPTCNSGYFYISVNDCKLVNSHNLTYTEAKRQLAKLALKMGKLPTKEPNQFDPSIVTYKLCGFLD
jgi:hypothetical protein